MVPHPGVRRARVANVTPSQHGVSNPPLQALVKLGYQPVVPHSSK
jgi:hypothetical protein